MESGPPENASDGKRFLLTRRGLRAARCVSALRRSAPRGFVRGPDLAAAAHVDAARIPQTIKYVQLSQPPLLSFTCVCVKSTLWSD